jgi:exodeoxyribonuclease VII large subunit
MAPRPPASPPPGAGGGEPPALSVSQLAALIARALSDHLPTGVRVVGEVSQFQERTHWYFTVKDEGAVVSCVAFASLARRAGFVPEVGQRVLLTGRVDFWAKGGKTSFMVDRIEPVGAGALDLAFRKLCEELRTAGYFDEERKRPLPAFPRRIAIVTSRTGAALQDVLDTLRRRSPWVEVLLVDVRVQGQGAAGEVAAAVRAIGRAHRRLGVDVILVTRGGGSIEDLWAFNERAVADAIFEAPVPVVAAIGHETDTTVAELVADVRAATPTQAAVRIAPDAAAIRQQLSALDRRVGDGLRRLVQGGRHDLRAAGDGLLHALAERIRQAEKRVERASARLERHRPAAVYADRRAALRHAETRLRAAIFAKLHERNLAELRRSLLHALQLATRRRAELVEATARSLDLVGPLSVLRRGFSMTLRADGSAVRSASSVSPGETVRTRLIDGSFTSVVKHGGQTSSDAVRQTAPAARRPARRSAPDPNQLGLFGGGPGEGPTVNA